MQETWSKCVQLWQEILQTTAVYKQYIQHHPMYAYMYMHAKLLKFKICVLVVLNTWQNCYNWWSSEIAQGHLQPQWFIMIFWTLDPEEFTNNIPLISIITWKTFEACYINTLRPRQNGRHFADDMFKCIFLNENIWIPIEISLKFVPQGPVNNIPALVQIMAWRRPGDKPLSGPMMVRLPMHICVTRPQWVKNCLKCIFYHKSDRSNWK